MADFVLLHGAYHGGWCWSRVSPLLQAQGHRVFTPTQTGLGERAHLLHAGITLDLFVRDVTGLLEAEELAHAVLVGHSFGGFVIAGAADRMEARIGRMIYLDAMIARSGITPLDMMLPEAAVLRRRMAAETGFVAVPAPDPGTFGVPPGADADWLVRRITPHPFGAQNTALTLANPPGNGLPCTYVFCNNPVHAPLAGHRAHARELGWDWRELAAGHDCMVTAPEQTADLLMEIAR